MMQTLLFPQVQGEGGGKWAFNFVLKEEGVLLWGLFEVGFVAISYIVLRLKKRNRV